MQAEGAGSVKKVTGGTTEQNTCSMPAERVKDKA